MSNHEGKSAHDTLLSPALLEALLLSVAPALPDKNRAAALREKTLSQAGAQPGAPVFYTQRATQDTWQSLAPLVDIKLLHEDDSGCSFILRLQPGARLPPHDHPGNEICLVLEGEGYIGDIYLRAGDFHLATKGLTHGETYTDLGALLFIHTASKEYRAGT